MCLCVYIYVVMPPVWPSDKASVKSRKKKFGLFVVIKHLNLRDKKQKLKSELKVKRVGM